MTIIASHPYEKIFALIYVLLPGKRLGVVGAKHVDKRTDKCRSRSTLIVDFSFPSKAQKQ